MNSELKQDSPQSIINSKVSVRDIAIATLRELHQSSKKQIKGSSVYKPTPQEKGKTQEIRLQISAANTPCHRRQKIPRVYSFFNQFIESAALIN